MKFYKIIAVIGVAVVAALPLNGQMIRLATLTPDNSPWNDTLYAMGSEWSRTTGGRIRLNVYPNGRMGSEANVIRLMRIDQIDAAVLTPLGLQQIVPETLVMNLPFLLQDEDELNLMIDQFAPTLNSRFLEEGFVVLAWAQNGWVYFFSDNEVRTPEDLRSNSVVGVSPDEDALVEAWRRLGFRIHLSSINNTLLDLQNGNIDAFYANPIAALSFQWFAFAREMLNIPMSGVVGAIVMRSDLWERISEPHQRAMLRAAQTAAAEFQRGSSEMNREAIALMRRNGLQVNDVASRQREQWVDLMREEGYPMIVGTRRIVPTSVYQRLAALLERHRR